MIKRGLDSALFYAKRGKRNKHKKWKIEKLKVGYRKLQKIGF